MMNHRAVFMTIAILFCSVITVQAQVIIYVDDSSTNGLNDGTSWANAFVDLQDAIAVANSNGTEIRVARGEYWPDKGVSQVLGDRQATFELANGVALRGGYAGYGSTSPDIRDLFNSQSVLSGDLAHDDGVEFINSSENSYHVVTATGCDATAVIDGFVICSGNADGSGFAGYGGGVFVSNGSPTIVSCTITCNLASSNGGGLAAYSGSSPFVNNCSFTQNHASVCGGGIDSDGELLIENTTVSDNIAFSTGGGINGTGGGILTQSTISGNMVSGGGNGGGIHADGGEWIIRQSTIANNHAESAGGGIHRDTGTVTLQNSLVAMNSSEGAGPDVSGVFDSVNSEYNLIGIIDGSTGLDVDTNGIAGSVAEPLNPHIGLLGDNGGLPRTHALLPSSPAINAGNNTLAIAGTNGLPLETDQRGNGYPRITDSTVDIGAVEGLSTPALNLTDPEDITIRVGTITPITWDQASLPVGSVLGLYYDIDTSFNGNEFWIDVDIDPNSANGEYLWSPVLIHEGDYYIGGRAIDPVTGQELHDRLDYPVTITYEGAYVVDSLEDVVANDGVTTLREALMAANTNENQGDAPGGSSVNVDVILFTPELASGTVELSGFSLPISDNTWILGPGSGLLTIDANDLSRIFTITGDSETHVWVTGLTVYDGCQSDGHGGGIYNDCILTLDDVTVSSCRLSSYSCYGGGIYSSGPLAIHNSVISGSINQGRYGQGGGIYCVSQLELIGTTISGNSVTYDACGGGIWCKDGTIESCILTNNSASRDGGGIYHYSGTLAIADTKMESNSSSSYHGGCVYNYGGILTLENAILTDSASGYGGALYNCSNASMTLRNSNIQNNTARYSGGGIHNDGTLFVANSTLAGNQSSYTSGDRHGGGIYGSGTVTLIQTTVSGNSASTGSGHGGGLHVTGGTWLIRQSTIANNGANGEGGGIYQSGGTVTLFNSIVAGNTAVGAGQDVRGTFDADSCYNLIGIVNDAVGLGDCPDTIAGTLALPLDAGLGALADNGGLTPTHQLLSTSPAIDMGSSEEAVDQDGDPLVTDQRGIGFVRVEGAGVDIGACEGDSELVFELTGSVPATVAVGSVLPVSWTQGTIPMGRSSLSLYADTDSQVNGNEFWFLRDADVDDLVAGYEWVVIGLDDLTADYTIGGVLTLDTGEMYSSRMSTTFQVVYGGTLYTVDSLNDVVASDGEVTLREAITASNLNNSQGDAPAGSSDEMDVIEFSPGLIGETIELAGFALEVNDDLFIRGPGSELLTIDANDLSRICAITGGNRTNIWIAGLTAHDGYRSEGHGGGIYNDCNLTLDDVTVSSCRLSSGSCHGGGIYSSGPLIVRDSWIKGNTTYSSSTNCCGGGIYCSGNLELTNVILENNSAYENGGGLWCKSGTIESSILKSNSVSRYGGGIYHYSGTLAIADTKMESNSSGYNPGGSVYNYGGVLTLENAILTDSVSDYGGALYNYTNASMILRNTNIENNTARIAGGGITNDGVLLIENSTLAGNRSSNTSGDRHGGGIYGSGTVTLIQTTVSDNSASTGNGHGGGLHVTGGTWLIRQSTIANNSANGEGGGIYQSGGTVTLFNTIVAGNTAVGAGQDVRGTFNADSCYNLIGIVNDAVGLGDCPDTIAGTLALPLDAGLGALADNGGLTPTHQLLSASPAIDMGSSEEAVDQDGDPLVTDQRGTGFARVDGAGVDIGACEGDSELAFELIGSVPATVAVGSVLPVSWTQGTIPMGRSSLSLYADTDSQVNGNEFWFLRDADVDDLVAGYDWVVIGLDDLSADYTIGGVLTLDTGEVNSSRMSTTFQIVYAGTVYTVDSTADLVANDGQLTLREAALAANQNQNIGDAPAGTSEYMDVIEFAPGLIGEAIELAGFSIEINDDLFIRGPGSELLTVDANDLSRIFTITGDSETHVWITGLTVYDGYQSGGHGGGIFNDSSLVLDDMTVSSCRVGGESYLHGGGIYSTGSLTVRDSWIKGNETSYSYGSGGGIFCSGSLGLTNVTLENNSAQNYGGGLWCNEGCIELSLLKDNSSNSEGGGLRHESGVLLISDSLITENRASSSGGGVSNYGGTLLVNRVEISSNYDAGYGAGVRNRNGAEVIIRNTSISDNTADNSGGGIYNEGVLSVENTTLRGNVTSCTSCQSRGGGIYGSGTVKLIQCTVSGNSADSVTGSGYGGGLYISDGSWLIQQSTIVDNTTATEGGGVYRSNGTVTLYNTIVADNSAVGSGQDVRGTFQSVSCYNFIENVNDSVGLGDCPFTITGLDPELGPLADNGGPTLTHRPRSTSNVIDVGSNSFAVGLEGDILVYDQRGPESLRLIGLNVDIGSVEYNAQAGDNLKPTIGQLLLSEFVIHVGDTLTLTAVDVQDDHGVVSVSFYRDVDRDGQCSPDELLGIDTVGSDGDWSVAVEASWQPGLFDYLAVATDNGVPSGVLTSDPISVYGAVLATDPPHITVGDHVIRANQDQLRVPVYVTGLDRVSGFDFVAELGDGDGPGVEPVFSGVDFDGGIWDVHPYMAAGGPVPGIPMRLDAGIVFSDAALDTMASGLLMTLVIDTTGFASGEVFDLKLTGTTAPGDTDPLFVLFDDLTLEPVTTNGTIRLFETIVVDHHVFYNYSYYDEYNPAASSGDDDAIATEKVRLFQCEPASFASYTNFGGLSSNHGRGINGIMLDVMGLQSAPAMSDFEFRIGNDSDPEMWEIAPAPIDLSFRTAEGTDGSDRVTLLWEDGAIENAWLEIQFKHENTGLEKDNIFYFGNAVGDSGNNPNNAYVDGTDMAAVRDNYSYGSPVPVTSRYDYNRDGQVNLLDMSIARDNATNYVTALHLITPGCGKDVSEPRAEQTDVTSQIVIDVGTHRLVGDRSGQQIELFVTSEPEATDISGFNLRAEIGDGDGPIEEPIFESIDFSGGIWEEHPTIGSGGIIDGHPQHVQESILFSQAGREVRPDGLLVTLTIDTTGYPAGQTFDLKLAATDIGQNSDFIIVGDQAVEPTIYNGTIEIVIPEPADIDEDGDVDLDDYTLMADCLAGPGVTTPPDTCPDNLFDASDLDRDYDVDLQDYSLFQNAFESEE